MTLNDLYLSLPGVDHDKIDQALEWPIAVMRGEQITLKPSSHFIAARVHELISRHRDWFEPLRLEGVQHISVDDDVSVEALDEKLQRHTIGSFLTCRWKPNEFSTHTNRLADKVSEAMMQAAIEPALARLQLPDHIEVVVTSHINITLQNLLLGLIAHKNVQPCVEILSLYRDVFICGYNKGTVIYLTA